MSALNRTYLLAGGVVVAGLAFFYFYGKGEGGGGFLQEVGQDVGEGAVGAVIDLTDGVIGGAVNRIGDVFGVPRTNMTECEKAKAEGRTWDASFACPAGDFLKYLIF